MKLVYITAEKKGTTDVIHLGRNEDLTECYVPFVKPVNKDERRSPNYEAIVRPSGIAIAHKEKPSDGWIARIPTEPKKEPQRNVFGSILVFEEQFEDIELIAKGYNYNHIDRKEFKSTTFLIAAQPSTIARVVFAGAQMYTAPKWFIFEPDRVMSITDSEVYSYLTRYCKDPKIKELLEKGKERAYQRKFLTPIE